MNVERREGATVPEIEIWDIETDVFEMAKTAVDIEQLEEIDEEVI